MKTRTISFIASVLFLFFIQKMQAQQDSLQYKVSIGVSALNFWDDGLRSYKERLDQNIAPDIIYTGNLFINNFTLDLKMQSGNKYGRISYLVATDASPRSINIRSLMVTYGLDKSYFNKSLDLNTEAGLGFSLLIDSEELTIKNEITGALGMGFDINIWKGLYIDNRLRGIVSFAKKKVYFSHTIALGYRF